MVYPAEDLQLVSRRPADESSVATLGRDGSCHVTPLASLHLAARVCQLMAHLLRPWIVTAATAAL